MKLRLLTAGIALALLAMFVATPLTAGAAPKTAGGTASLTGGGFLGTVTNLTATVNNLGQTVVSGTFGPGSTLTDPITGVVTQLVGQTFSTIVTGGTASAACQILDLTVGPINLDLLGLVITTNTIKLNITAQPGPGNLLGNLLCTVARLLDSSASGNAIANLLNRVFGLLG
jgi:hypothetical protein